MDHRLRWLGACLLALVAPSCMATTALHEWASKEYSHAEVIGVLDRGGAGEALILRLDGQGEFVDGLYEVPVAPRTEAQARFEPLRLGPADEAELAALMRESPKPQRTLSAAGAVTREWTAMPGYESVDGRLWPVVEPGRRYFVSVDGPRARPDAPGDLTKFALRTKRAVREPARLRGYAYLPPPERDPTRSLVGMVATPLTLAVDIVTFPVQAAVGVVGLALLTRSPGLEMFVTQLCLAQTVETTFSAERRYSLTRGPAVHCPSVFIAVRVSLEAARMLSHYGIAWALGGRVQLRTVPGT